MSTRILSRDYLPQLVKSENMEHWVDMAQSQMYRDAVTNAMGVLGWLWITVVSCVSLSMLISKWRTRGWLARTNSARAALACSSIFPEGA